MKLLDRIVDLIFVKNYKKVIFIPIVLFFLIIVINFLKYGEISEVFKEDITISGGFMIKVYNPSSELINFVKKNCYDTKYCDYNVISSYYGDKYLEIIVTNKGENIFKTIKGYLDKEGYKYTVSKKSEEIGRSIFKTMIYLFLICVIIITMIVYFFFRSILPSLSITLSTILTVFDTLFSLAFLEYPISIYVLGALLMIFGYSVGSDAILGVYLFKRFGRIEDRLITALKIVFLQEITSISVFIILFLLTTEYAAKVISLSMIFGIIYDFINTWLFTAQIQRMILERGK